MRKMKYLLMGLLVVVPFKISASSLSLSVNCPDTAYAGDTVSCTVSASTSGNINGVSGKFNLSSGLSYGGFTVAVSTNVNQVTSNGFALGNTSGFPTSFTVGTLKVTIPSSAQAGSTYTAGIKNISGSDTNYDDVSAGNASDTITVKEKQTTQQPSSGSSSSNTTPSSNNSTSSTNTNTGSNSTNSNSSGSKTTTNKEVNKSVDKSSNNNLKSIKLNSGNIEFLPYVTEYEVNVENSVDSINITYELEDTKASAKLEGSEKLNVGENIYKIKVTAENGSEKTYIIKVTRKEEGETLSNNNYLSSLKVEGYNISFDKEKLEYTVKIKDEKKLDITTELEDDKALVVVEGNENLTDGSIITVKVTAEDGSVRTYSIKITRKTNLVLPIISCSIAFIALVVVTILTIKKKKNKQK